MSKRYSLNRGEILACRVTVRARKRIEIHFILSQSDEYLMVLVMIKRRWWEGGQGVTLKEGGKFLVVGRKNTGCLTGGGVNTAHAASLCKK